MYVVLGQRTVIEIILNQFTSNYASLNSLNKHVILLTYLFGMDRDNNKFYGCSGKGVTNSNVDRIQGAATFIVIGICRINCTKCFTQIYKIDLFT